MYTIKDVMNKLGLTVHTVRYYCDCGLVPNLERDSSGNRLFDDESVNWLQAAVFLRASGMSVAEIKHYFDLCQKGEDAFEERVSILEELRDKTKKELDYAQYRYDCINEKLVHCEDIRAGKCPDDCNPLNW